MPTGPNLIQRCVHGTCSRKKVADEQEQDDADYGIDDRGLAQTAIVRLHQSEHSQKADESHSGFTDEKIYKSGRTLLRG